MNRVLIGCLLLLPFLGCQRPAEVVNPNNPKQTTTLEECPATFSLSDVGRSCSFKEESCSFKKADCGCVSTYPVICQGMIPTEEEQNARYAAILAAPHVYGCQIKDQSILRPDGCPYPVPRGRCQQEGQKCSYPEAEGCGGTRSTAVCKNGRWDVAEKLIPPPP